MFLTSGPSCTSVDPLLLEPCIPEHGACRALLVACVVEQGAQLASGDGCQQGSQDEGPPASHHLLQRWRQEVLRLLLQRRQLSTDLATAQEAAADAHVRRSQARLRRLLVK